MSASQSPVSRRNALKMLGLSSAAVALGNADRVSFAEEQPKAGSPIQGAGFYRQKVGSLEVTLISDGGFPFSQPHPLFGSNVSKEQIEAALARDFIPYDRAMGQVNALLVRTGRDVLLIDTGCGKLFGPGTGFLTQNLARAGVTPTDITAVFMTHFHPDHFGGLMTEGSLTFQNAQYFTHKTEQDFWQNPDFSKSGVEPEARGPMTQGAQKALAALKGKLTLLEGQKDVRIIEGVHAVPAPGHTPGHCAVHLASGNDQLLYITDAVHHVSILMPHPEYHVGFDTDMQQGVQTRKALLQRAASDRVLVSGAHVPFPGFGHVRKLGEGYEWVPTYWHW